MPSDGDPNNRDASHIDARLSAVETSVEGIQRSLSDISKSIDTLRTTYVDSRTPQYGTMIAAVGLTVVIVGAVGASFLAPVTVAVAAHERVIDKWPEQHEGLRAQITTCQYELIGPEKASDERFQALAAEVSDIKINGSGVTRERLAVIEHELVALRKDAAK